MLEADSMRSQGSLLQGRMAFSFHRFRQPGQGVCDCTVHLHHPDGHGCDPGSQQDVVQSQNHLAAIKRDWRDSGYRLSDALPVAPWAGALDKVICTPNTGCPVLGVHINEPAETGDFYLLMSMRKMRNTLLYIFPRLQSHFLPGKTIWHTTGGVTCDEEKGVVLLHG